MNFWALGFQNALLWQRQAMEQHAMWLSAAEVIWWRGLQMAAGQMSLREATRMTMEKPAAFAKGLEQGVLAAVQGKGPDKVTTAFLRPVSRRAHANARRLRRKVHYALCRLKAAQAETRVLIAQNDTVLGHRFEPETRRDLLALPEFRLVDAGKAALRIGVVDMGG